MLTHKTDPASAPFDTSTLVHAHNTHIEKGAHNLYTNRLQKATTLMKTVIRHPVGNGSDPEVTIDIWH